MLCPKCKNPIEDNTPVCEWCGAIFAVTEQEKQVKQTQLNSLDAELISLLKKGEKLRALKLYKERTGYGKHTCYYYVARLNFFLTHKDATEVIWQNYIKKSKRKYFLSRFIQWILLSFFLLLNMGFTIQKSIGGFLISIIIIFFIIFWMRKTKKIKILFPSPAWGQTK